MCDCLNNVEADFLDQANSQMVFGRVVEKAALRGVSLVFDGAGRSAMKTYNEVVVRIEGKKKAKTAILFHSYCPFCGEKNAEL